MSPLLMGMRVALARITLAAAVISATVSPFILRAVMKAPIWASVASPFIMASMARIISASVRSCRLTTLSMASLSMRFILHPM